MARLREAAGLSQLDLARLSGIDQSTISNIENGVVRDPRISTVQRLAQALGASIDELLSPRAKPGASSVRIEREIREARHTIERMAEALQALGSGQPSAWALALTIVPLEGSVSEPTPGTFREDDRYFLCLIMPEPDRDWLRRNVVRPRAVVVSDESLEPRLSPGDRVIFEEDASPRAGDVIVARVGERYLVRRFRREDHRSLLTSSDPHRFPDLAIGDGVTILGAAKMRIVPAQLDLLDSAPG